MILNIIVTLVGIILTLLIFWGILYTCRETTITEMISDEIKRNGYYKINDDKIIKGKILHKKKFVEDQWEE